MKLAKPFYRLPVQFDAQRLRDEVMALPEIAWVAHPNAIKGNQCVRLISAGGGENDHVDGEMQPTPHLRALPYVRQILASFGVVWGRSRLLKLDAYSTVPSHADINYHWFNRVRMHIPVLTNPEVRFFCGDASVHMAEGEAWIFDNWRLHRVENPADRERIHLVADTSGSASFWQFVAGAEAVSKTPYKHYYDRAVEVQPLTEKTTLRPVMSPAEIDLLVIDLQAELSELPGPNSSERLLRFREMLSSFRRDWRQLYELFGETAGGRSEYLKLIENVRLVSRQCSDNLIMRTNRIAADLVLEGRILRVAISGPPSPVEARARTHIKSRRTLDRPIFIAAAPRSGSTLLFETLAASEHICTVGGEAHWLVESIAALRPGGPRVESNRLCAEHADEAISADILNQIAAQLRDCSGKSVSLDTHLRFLEKTPKNALRVPFFNRIFPDALFIFLWRDPHENISTIVEAWRSGRWKTYNGLDGFDGPWSLVLPPRWQQLRGKMVEDIAAFQWESTNRILMDDLQALPPGRWISLRYAQLVSNTTETVDRLCRFAGIPFTGALAARVRNPLPPSRYTLTVPATGKWQNNREIVMRVLPQVEETWHRLLALR